MAQTHGIGKRRVQEVVDLVGLTDVARKRAGGFSLGMGQRLGIAAAMLGDPQTLILTSPPMAWIPRGSAGSLTCSKALRGKAARSFCPRT